MRVLLVHDEPIDAGYGAESYVRRLAAGLLTVGDEVALMAGDVRHEGIRRALDLWDPAARVLIRQRSQQVRPDVIHFHNVARELSASVINAVPDVPSVMTVHDLRLIGGREHAAASPRGLVETITTSAVRRTAGKHVTATIGVSHAVSRELARRGFPAVSTVGVPVIEPAHAPRPVAECRDLVVVARLAPDKGVDVVIAAFATVAGEHPDSRLVIAGDGPSRATLEVAAAPLGGQVQFRGRLAESDVSALLGQARAVVVASMPSRRPEGSSLSFVEAAVHGRPVIASDDPAVRELADSIGGCLVVPAGDHGALARAMRELLADGDRASQLGETGRANAMREHSVAAVTAATRAVYQAAITRPAA